MSRPITKTFDVERGVFVRRAVTRRGKPYIQKCELATFVEVAHLVDDRGERGLTTSEAWEALPDIPCTQASVALDFLKERGCVRVEGRRSYAASESPFEDALTEWHALTHVEDPRAPA